MWSSETQLIINDLTSTAVLIKPPLKLGHGWMITSHKSMDVITYIYTLFELIIMNVIMGVMVSIHQPHQCLLNHLFGRRSQKTPKLRVTGLCAGNSPGTGEFPAQMASNAENVSIWWRHHVNHINKGALRDVSHLIKQSLASEQETSH